MISLNVVAALMALNFLPASAAAIQARALKPIPVHIYDDLKYGGNHEEWLVPYKECSKIISLLSLLLTRRLNRDFLRSICAKWLERSNALIQSRPRQW